MFAEMQPLFWRIRDADTNGCDAVSLLMPSDDSGEPETEFPTDVAFLSRRRSSDIVDLKWSDDDSDLFLSLLERINPPENELEDEDGITLDINDGVVQGIVQLVALARFQTPLPSDELMAADINTLRDELEVGDLVSLNTLHGYCLAIVIGLDSIDATCVLLEDVCDDAQILINDHSVLVVNRMSVVSAAFHRDDLGEEATFH